MKFKIQIQIDGDWVAMNWQVLNEFILTGTDLTHHNIRLWTGLLDTNKNEIYEGDLLKIHLFTQELGENLGVVEGEREFIAEIHFQPYGLWLQAETEADSGYLALFDGIHEESFEIIENIYSKKKQQ